MTVYNAIIVALVREKFSFFWFRDDNDDDDDDNDYDDDDDDGGGFLKHNILVWAWIGGWWGLALTEATLHKNAISNRTWESPKPNQRAHLHYLYLALLSLITNL